MYGRSITSRQLGQSYIFGDNKSVVSSCSIPEYNLKKSHHALSFHRVREAIASGVINLIHIPGKDNPADVLTKSLVHPALYGLTKPFIFYSKDQQPVGEEKKKELSWADVVEKATHTTT